jgi:hypothetical protein
MEKLPELWKRLKPFVVRDLQIALSPKKTTFSSETPIGIQLIFPGGNTKLYPVNEDGFRAALAASVDGCSIIIPAATITFTGSININKKIKIIGTKSAVSSSDGHGTVLKCTQDVGTNFISISGWVRIDNLSASYETSRSGTIRAINSSYGGGPEFSDLYVSAINNGTGDAIALYLTYGKFLQNVIARAYASSGYAYGVNWYNFDGSAKYCNFSADTATGIAIGGSLTGTSNVYFYYCEFTGKTKGLVIGIPGGG